jgi:glycine/D-amino acid oxidase-like deaminating enzyme
MPDDSLPPLTLSLRIRVLLRLVLSLRRHDFRAARTFMAMTYPHDPAFVRMLKFFRWAITQMWCTMPDAMRDTHIDSDISPVPVWLKHGNPLANHPWAQELDAKLPEVADTVVIGCGLAGCAVAYHWGRTAPSHRTLVALDMDDAATGSAGRNEGLVVMGRYFHMVVHTVLPWLQQVRGDLTADEQLQLARQFAAKYSHACYRNADMVEQAVRDEGFECNYAREGWVQARDEDQQDSLAESVRMAVENGYRDWSSISPTEVKRRTGMNVRHNAGFSMAAASFHPAKWCWSLLQRGMESGQVRHFSRTKTVGIEDAGEYYIVRTARGDIRARHIVLCTESWTPLLMPQFHNLIRPTQTQAASGPGGPPEMKPHVGISGSRAFFGRHFVSPAPEPTFQSHDSVSFKPAAPDCENDNYETMIGSDATRVPDSEAGRSQPSRFLTHYLCTELQAAFGRAPYTITNEWSGTVSYTPDEFPVLGVFDGKRQHIIGGMAGSGTAVSFNGARCIVNRILNNTSEPDDYPDDYFSPMRLLDPLGHVWPELDTST